MKRERTLLDLLDHGVDRIVSVTKWVMLTMASAIFLIVVVTVFTRYVLNYVASWSEEVPRYLLVWISLLGAALAVEYKEHIGFDYLFNMLPGQLQVKARLVLNLGVGALGLVMLIYGIGFVREFGDDLMESIPFTNKWYYSAMPISGGLIVLFVARQELRGLVSMFGDGGAGRDP